jgi:GIY-YIG catalytic domain-containing protein
MNETPATGFIYSIKNTANGKEYIGQTRHDPRKRFYVHKSVSRGNGGSRSFSVVHRAMQKYGEAAFVLEVVEADVPLAWLDVRERHWIRERVSLAPCGYNQEPGGICGERGELFSAKMSATNRGKRKTLAHRVALAVSARRRGQRQREARAQRDRFRLPADLELALKVIHVLPGKPLACDKSQVRALIAKSLGYADWRIAVVAASARTRRGWKSPVWRGGAKIARRRSYKKRRKALLIQSRLVRLGKDGIGCRGPWRKRAALVAELLLVA